MTLLTPVKAAARPIAGDNDHPYPPLRLQEVQYETRVFEIDVLHCPRCGGGRRLIALITDPLVVRRILHHLDLPCEPPPIAPARPPPQMVLGF